MGIRVARNRGLCRSVRRRRWGTGADRAAPRLALVLALTAVSPAGVSADPTTPPRDRFDVVVLDAGHGGANHGARGTGALSEKDLVLEIAVRLAQHLEAAGLRVVLSRSRDILVPLEQRVAIANDARADLFLSLHANWAPSPRARGFEAYVLSHRPSDESARRLAERENAAAERGTPTVGVATDPLLLVLGDLVSTEQRHESHALAHLLKREFAALPGGISRGVKQAPFVVLTGLQMPAVLLELGFLSNPQEAAQLRDPAHREKIVQTIAGAVQRYGRRYDARRGLVAAPP